MYRERGRERERNTSIYIYIYSAAAADGWLSYEDSARLAETSPKMGRKTRGMKTCGLFDSRIFFRD